MSVPDSRAAAGMGSASSASRSRAAVAGTGYVSPLSREITVRLSMAGTPVALTGFTASYRPVIVILQYREGQLYVNILGSHVSAQGFGDLHDASRVSNIDGDHIRDAAAFAAPNREMP